MLTPRFELSQTDKHINIIIHAPYANIKDTLIHVGGTDFRFYSTPYYLRLSLPGEIEENDASSGDYYCEKGDFILTFSKVNKGEYFENLDMITTLMAPVKKKSNLVPIIEVITNPCTSNETNSATNMIKEQEYEIKNDSGNEWYIQQNPVEENIDLLLKAPKYGFGNKISGALAVFEDVWIKEIIDLPMPDKTLLKDRKILREQQEFESFNEEHYMADLIEVEYIKPCLAYESEWDKFSEFDVYFNDEEKDLLKELSNKEYLLDECEIKTVLNSMVDILFASCYNCRTTIGENTVESSWTINKLSSTLSWFQSFENMHEVILSCIKRSLCYPLMRNWNLSLKIFEDVKKVIKLGRKYILKRFCEIYSLFNNSYEPRYILNQLYIKDYLIWLQQIPETFIDEVSLLLEDIIPCKEHLGLDLIELEKAAYATQNEVLVIENELYSLPEDLEKLGINDDHNRAENGISMILRDNSNSDSESDSSSSSSNTSSTNSSSSNSTYSSTINNIKQLQTNENKNCLLDSDDESN